MKKILKSALLVTALTNLLTAGTIFDLQAQHFSNSNDGDGVAAKYDLPNVYVSTALKYINGFYTLVSTSTQTMSVELKSPPANWSVSFDMSYYLNNQTHPIRFTSDTGRTITVTFKYYYIFLNGVKIYNGSSLDGSEAVTGTITKSGNTVTCTIAGFVTKTITVSDFSNLKFVNVSLLHDSYTDHLNGLNIASN